MIQIKKREDNTCYEQTKIEMTQMKKIGSDSYPVNILWYKTKNQDLHFCFIHPLEIMEFPVKKDDGLFYDAMKNLYQMLEFVEELNPQKKKNGNFYMATDIQQTGTADGFLLEKKKNGFILRFDEFSPFQRGYTDITICKESKENRVNYTCLNQAYLEFLKQYNLQDKKVLQKERSSVF